MPTVTAEKEMKVPAPTLIEPFLARLNDCVNQVLKLYPNETLFWVKGTGQINGPLHEDKEVSNLEMQFQNVAAYAIWNRIDTPIKRAVGLGVQKLPALNTLLPLADAIKKMGQPFMEVDLTWPLTPEAKRPFYVFKLMDGKEIRIDA
jgi:hypothetical protein